MLFIITFENTSFVAEILVESWDEAIDYAKRRGGGGDYEIHFVKNCQVPEFNPDPELAF